MNYTTFKPFFSKSRFGDEVEEEATEPQKLYSRNKPRVEGHRGKAAAPPHKAAESKPNEDINESAEAFIKRFRQQLLRQWMESSMDNNYDQFIKRGVY